MVIAALVIFAVLFVGWLLAPGWPTSPPESAADEPELRVVDASKAA